jgi:hypothetical protein
LGAEDHGDTAIREDVLEVPSAAAARCLPARLEVQGRTQLMVQAVSRGRDEGMERSPP